MKTLHSASKYSLKIPQTSLLTTFSSSSCENLPFLFQDNVPYEQVQSKSRFTSRHLLLCGQFTRGVGRWLPHPRVPYSVSTCFFFSWCWEDLFHNIIGPTCFYETFWLSWHSSLWKNLYTMPLPHPLDPKNVEYMVRYNLQSGVNTGKTNLNFT